MILNRKTASVAQASRQVSVPAQCVVSPVLSSSKSVFTVARGVLTPTVAISSKTTRRMVETRAVAETTAAPSSTKQEKTTNPMNLVFVATEVGGFEGAEDELELPVSSIFALYRLLPGQRLEVSVTSWEVGRSGSGERFPPPCSDPINADRPSPPRTPHRASQTRPQRDHHRSQVRPTPATVLRKKKWMGSLPLN